jgi:hypothetical protein
MEKNTLLKIKVKRISKLKKSLVNFSFIPKNKKFE